MSHYEIYDPIALSPANFEAFKRLVLKQNDATLMPADIAAFAAQDQADPYVKLKRPDGRDYMLLQDKAAGVYTQVHMWAPKSAQDNYAHMAALLLDVKKHDDDTLDYTPRQWVIGSKAQLVLPYKMECCQGMSAVASYRQGGAAQSVLLENARFVDAHHQNLFRLGADDSGFRLDETNDMIGHFYVHLKQIPHHCQGLKVPKGVSGQHDHDHGHSHPHDHHHAHTHTPKPRP